MDEIFNMTIAQIKMYSRELSELRREEFKTNIISSLYGSRIGTEELQKVLN